MQLSAAMGRKGCDPDKYDDYVHVAHQHGSECADMWLCRKTIMEERDPPNEIALDYFRSIQQATKRHPLVAHFGDAPPTVHELQGRLYDIFDRAKHAIAEIEMK